jgi:hypothetical protein
MQIQMINIKVRMVKNFCVPILQEELKAWHAYKLKVHTWWKLQDLFSLFISS